MTVEKLKTLKIIPTGHISSRQIFCSNYIDVKSCINFAARFATEACVVTLLTALNKEVADVFKKLLNV